VPLPCGVILPLVIVPVIEGDPFDPAIVNRESAGLTQEELDRSEYRIVFSKLPVINCAASCQSGAELTGNPYRLVGPGTAMLWRPGFLVRLAFDEIDLVALNDASPILRFEAVSDRPVNVTDLERRAAFVSLTAREYEDEMAQWRMALQDCSDS
jgi:hypothetical protein